MLGIVQKTTLEQLDYDVDFSRWIPDGDTIQAGAVEITPDDGTLVAVSYEINGQVVKVWLSGGTAGKSYTVAVTIGTAAGRMKEACFGVRVRNC
ncbi:virion-associated phage protein [Burkholderia phage Bcep22]|uniref:Virion-associated phage protein n=1 Tax=Burkholderia phage Bcep22 TaxID=2883944 RepID=Q6V7N0_9CAUD|nr:virion-associated phage protein [Burkholderia phage Bcep22]AAQ54996.2 virion-associated phage protein [Burkholderia phage Bcep22]